MRIYFSDEFSGNKRFFDVQIHLILQVKFQEIFKKFEVSIAIQALKQIFTLILFLTDTETSFFVIDFVNPL